MKRGYFDDFKDLKETQGRMFEPSKALSPASISSQLPTIAVSLNTCPVYCQWLCLVHMPSALSLFSVVQMRTDSSVNLHEFAHKCQSFGKLVRQTNRDNPCKGEKWPRSCNNASYGMSLEGSECMLRLPKQMAMRSVSLRHKAASRPRCYA